MLNMKLEVAQKTVLPQVYAAQIENFMSRLTLKGLSAPFKKVSGVKQVAGKNSTS